MQFGKKITKSEAGARFTRARFDKFDELELDEGYVLAPDTPDELRKLRTSISAYNRLRAPRALSIKKQSDTEFFVWRRA